MMRLNSRISDTFYTSCAVPLRPQRRLFVYLSAVYLWRRVTVFAD
jgi:hypothetical protein